MNDPIFHATQLTKVYRSGEVDVYALRGVDLELYRGEMAVLLGPSGSGRSTLLTSSAGSIVRPPERHGSATSS